MVSKGWRYPQVNVCHCVCRCIYSHISTIEDEKSENKEVASPQQGIEKPQGKQLCSCVCSYTLCMSLLEYGITEEKEEKEDASQDWVENSPSKQVCVCVCVWGGGGGASKTGLEEE